MNLHDRAVVVCVIALAASLIASIGQGAEVRTETAPRILPGRATPAVARKGAGLTKEQQDAIDGTLVSLRNKEAELKKWKRSPRGINVPAKFGPGPNVPKIIKNLETLICALRAHLKCLKAGDGDYAITDLERYLLDGKFGIGSAGKLEGTRVIQVLSKEAVLLSIWKPGTWYSRYEPIKRKTIWFSGIDTSGIVDGAALPFNGIVVIVGTKQGTDIAGAKRTVFAARPVKPPEDKIIEKALDATPKGRR